MSRFFQLNIPKLNQVLKRVPDYSGTGDGVVKIMGLVIGKRFLVFKTFAGDFANAKDLNAFAKELDQKIATPKFDFKKMFTVVLKDIGTYLDRDAYINIKDEISWKLAPLFEYVKQFGELEWFSTANTHEKGWYNNAIEIGRDLKYLK